jgi:hypothetical protein
MYLCSSLKSPGPERQQIFRFPEGKGSGHNLAQEFFHAVPRRERPQCFVAEGMSQTLFLFCRSGQASVK